MWDITYLPTAVRGVFFYLYLMVDLFSRKVVGFRVHADDGGPMNGSTMLATRARAAGSAGVAARAAGAFHRDADCLS